MRSRHWNSLSLIQIASLCDGESLSGLPIGITGILPSRLYCYLGTPRSTEQETAAIQKIVCWMHGSLEQGEGTTPLGFILAHMHVGQEAGGQRSDMGMSFSLWYPWETVSRTESHRPESLVWITVRDAEAVGLSLFVRDWPWNDEGTLIVVLRMQWGH